MRKMRDGFQKFLNRFWKEETGQSTTEYILILAVVVMIAMKFQKSFKKTMGTQMQNLDNKLNSAFDDSGD